MAAVTGARMVHVPYKGGAQAMADLIAGQVQLLFVSAPTAVPQIQSGKIRAFAVTVPKPIAALPDVPTFAAQGYPEPRPADGERRPRGQQASAIAAGRP
jgi:tripartite-type tricarboxylate transporter receptor subunit TctC